MRPIYIYKANVNYGAFFTTGDTGFKGPWTVDWVFVDAEGRLASISG